MSPSAIRAYLKAIADRHRRGDATEHSYRGDLETLLRAMLQGVDITNEPRRITDCGAPDYVLARGGVPLGYIEAKDLDKSLGNLPKRDQAQFKRYLQSLDNFIFTNYIEFRLYRDGETTAASTATIMGNSARFENCWMPASSRIVSPVFTRRPSPTACSWRACTTQRQRLLRAMKRQI